MSVHVSEIHAAGGLDKWIRCQCQNDRIPNEDSLRREKMRKVNTDSGRAKNESKNQKTAVPTEHDEQVAFIRWAEGTLNPHVFALLFAIPNGGQRSKAVAGKLKAEGVKAGIPDLMLAVPRNSYHGLFIEMKKPAGGSVSPSQAKMVLKLQGEGYHVEICNGCDEAVKAVQTYLGMEGLA